MATMSQTFTKYHFLYMVTKEDFEMVQNDNSWILMGLAKECGGWEMALRSSLAGDLESLTRGLEVFLKVALLNLFHYSSKIFRFARRFDHETDRHTMRFQLNRCKIYLNLKGWNGSPKLI